MPSSNSIAKSITLSVRSMFKQECQFLIVGAGIIGLTIAHELVNRGMEDILILEKERSLGLA